MYKSEDKICGTCFFFVLDGKDKYETQYGRCHRYPPQATAYKAVKTDVE